MIFSTKNNRQVILRKLNPGDYDDLCVYLDKFSSETKKRFGPHPFDKNSVIEFYRNDLHTGYIAQDTETSAIVAYSIIKIGFLEHDAFRLQAYGLKLDGKTDATFAPSVADAWQSHGIGNALFSFIISDLKLLEIKRIILWGGVQSDNHKAVNYYRKNGFKTLGEFHYNGLNLDMALQIM
jgi:diamine N-acetyltransferase